jgi:formylglycine-generating enzyme required for sulfatase activity
LKLDPYFIGRTEVPQSVWQRVMRSNPAQYQPPTMPASDYAPQLPVEYVDWDQCATFLARTDLVFPTEAQWERAARGGEATPTLYGVGDDPAQLEDRENVHDQTIPASARSASAAPFLDGYELTAPIARFEPNGFGLHDVIGNVAEWCADPFVASVPETTARGDGLVESEGARFRAFRGGSFYQPPQNCRLTLRQHDLPVGANQTRGLRVARPVR